MLSLFGSSGSTGSSVVGLGGDVLANWYISRSNAAVARTLASSTASQAANPAVIQGSATPPWESASQPKDADVLRKAMASDDFLDAETLGGFEDVEAPQDAKKLFALHEAVRRLRVIADAANQKGVSDLDRDFFDRRFQSGLAQVNSFLGGAEFESLSVALGAERTSASSALKIGRTNAVYKTQTLHDGAYDAEVARFTGDVAFSLNVKKADGSTIDISVDLAELGGATRTLDAVATLINDKLSAAGLTTRFARVKIGTPDAETGVVPGQSFGFEIKGTDVETLSFSAADGAAALSLAHRSGGTDAAAAFGQLSRLDDLNGSTLTPLARWTAAAQADGLEIASAREGPNGSIYMLARADGGATGAPRPAGEADLVLAKYDSAGAQVWARTLGVGAEATGLSLAVGADGQVAVAGKVTGALGQTVALGGDDAFVLQIDAQGRETALTRFGTLSNDDVRSVAIGADGSVFVAGSVSGGLNGSTHGGGRDGYVRAIDTSGAALWTRQIGTAGEDAVSALTIAPDGNLLVASVEDGQGVVRKLDVADPEGAPLWEHVLGDLDEGRLSAVAVDAAGAVYVAGAARSGFALPTGAANAGERDGFVVRLDESATVGAAPTVGFASWLGTSAEDTIADLRVVDGAVFVAGRTDGDVATGLALEGRRDAFFAKLDAGSGAVVSTQAVQGRDGQAAAVALTLDEGFSASLNALGLPRGTIRFTDLDTVSERSPARVGDYFELKVNGGAKRRVTLAAGDTLRALAFKVQNFLVLDGKAESAGLSTGRYLKITPNPGVTIELIAGPAGRDLLGALGVEAGRVSEKDPEAKPTRDYALNMSTLGSLTKAAGLKDIITKLDGAASTLRRAYRELGTPIETAEAGPGRRNQSSAPPAYLLAQLANYQDALSRLGG